MSASASECKQRRDEIIEAIRQAGLNQDAGPLMQVPDQLEAAAAAGCLDRADAEALIEAVRRLGNQPTVVGGQPIRKRVRAAFADATQDFGDLQAQRDEQQTLGEAERPQRREVGEGARREDPEQGQTRFGESGELEGQQELGGGFAGPREEPGGEEREERERPKEGVRSLREFAEDNGPEADRLSPVDVLAQLEEHATLDQSLTDPCNQVSKALTDVLRFVEDLGNRGLRDIVEPDTFARDVRQLVEQLLDTLAERGCLEPGGQRRLQDDLDLLEQQLRRDPVRSVEDEVGDVLDTLRVVGIPPAERREREGPGGDTGNK